jgi:hypothetical protein
MKTLHRIEFAEGHLQEAQRLAISQNPMLKFMFLNAWGIWAPVLALVIALLAFYLLHELSLMVGLLFGLAIIFAFIGRFLCDRGLANARRQNPMNGAVVTYSMSEAGLDIVTPVNRSHLEWSAFSGAIDYPQGVLLKIGTRAYMWLPDRALVEGAPADFRQLVGGCIQQDSGNAK